MIALLKRSNLEVETATFDDKHDSRHSSTSATVL